MTSLQEQLSRLSPEKRQLVLRKLQARSATSPASPELEGGPLVITNRGGPLPLSSAQQRLWFLDQLEGPGAAYIMTSAVRLRGRLDVGALLDSLREIVGRHEILRTTFWEEDGQPRQVISLETRLDVEVFDWIGLGEKEHAECVHRLIRAESETPFDLKKGPLIRVKLGLSHPLSTGDGEGVLVLSVHHIVADFWSMEVLIKEWKCLYEARVEGHLADLKPLPIQYADYAAWERKLQSGGRRREHVDYWTTQLDGAPPVLELPLDFIRPSAPSPREHRLFFEISSTLADGLRGVAQRCGATPFMALQAVFALLLARTSRQRDVVVGTVVANRPRPELESMIGFFCQHPAAAPIPRWGSLVRRSSAPG